MHKDDEQKDPKNDENEEVDDVVIEEESEEASPQDVIKKLREKLKKAQEEKQEYLDGWQRERADTMNRKKRDEEERARFISLASEGIIEDILPALDSFDLAFGNKEAWEKADKNWRIGVEYIYSQLLSALEKNGVKQISPLHQTLDPILHEPIDVIETEKKDEEGKVLAVLQKGYQLNGKVIRPAKVKVGELKK